MFELSDGLHHHDAEFDHASPEDFKAFLMQLSDDDKLQLSKDILARFHTYAQYSIHHHDMAALGIASNRHYPPGRREHVKATGDVLLRREETLANLQQLAGIALGAVAQPPIDPSPAFVVADHIE